MSLLLRRLCRLQSTQSSLCRSLHTTTSKSHMSYNDGELKPKIDILQRLPEFGLMIEEINQYGFKLNNGGFVIGPIVMLPGLLLSWNVGKAANINKESLTLFSILAPKVDIIVLGVEVSGHPSNPVIKDLLKLTKSLNIPAEILPTKQACATYNFLISEGRLAGGAFIPPMSEDSRKKKIVKDYEEDET